MRDYSAFRYESAVVILTFAGFFDHLDTDTWSIVRFTSLLYGSEGIVMDDFSACICLHLNASSYPLPLSYFAFIQVCARVPIHTPIRTYMYLKTDWYKDSIITWRPFLRSHNFLKVNKCPQFLWLCRKDTSSVFLFTLIFHITFNVIIKTGRVDWMWKGQKYKNA